MNARPLAILDVLMWSGCSGLRQPPTKHYSRRDDRLRHRLHGRRGRSTSNCGRGGGNCRCHDLRLGRVRPSDHRRCRPLCVWAFDIAHYLARASKTGYTGSAIVNLGYLEASRTVDFELTTAALLHHCPLRLFFRSQDRPAAASP